MINFAKDRHHTYVSHLDLFVMCVCVSMRVLNLQDWKALANRGGGGGGGGGVGELPRCSPSLRSKIF